MGALRVSPRTSCPSAPGSCDHTNILEMPASSFASVLSRKQAHWVLLFDCALEFTCRVWNPKPPICHLKGKIRGCMIIFQVTAACNPMQKVTTQSYIYFFFLLGRLEDQYVIRFVKEKLKSMPCRNQGYILDGFPKTYDQAKDLFNSKSQCALCFECEHSDKAPVYSSE